MWKKEEELKQLKSELAALDRKIQLELAPPTPEITEKEHPRNSLCTASHKKPGVERAGPFSDRGVTAALLSK